MVILYCRDRLHSYLQAMDSNDKNRYTESTDNIAPNPSDDQINRVAQQLLPMPPYLPQLRYRARHRSRPVIHDPPRVEAMGTDHRNLMGLTERRTKEDQSSVPENQLVSGPYVVTTCYNHQQAPLSVQGLFRHSARLRSSQEFIHEGPRATIPNNKGLESMSSFPACVVSSHGGHVKGIEHLPSQLEGNGSRVKACENNVACKPEHDVAYKPDGRVFNDGEKEKNDFEVIFVEQSPGNSKRMYEQPRAPKYYFGIGDQQEQRGSSKLDDCLRRAMAHDTDESKLSSQGVGNSVEGNSHANICSVEAHRNCHQDTTISEDLSLPQLIGEWQHLQHASEDYSECMQEHHIHARETSYSFNAKSSDKNQQALPKNHVSDSNHVDGAENNRHVTKEVDDHSQHTHCHVTKISTDLQSDQEQTYEYLCDYSQVGVVLDDRPSEPQLIEDESKEEDKACANNDEDLENRSQGEGLFPSLDMESPPLFLGFNQDTTRFVCGSSRGFRVYDTDAMKECVCSMLGGVCIAEFHASNDIIFLVGGGPNPSFPPNKVVVWNAAKAQRCGELVHIFPVRAVKVRRDRIVVVVDNEVYIYNHANGRLLFQVSTTTNTKGLCVISTKEGPSILACPGLKRGEVRVEHIGMNRGIKKLPTRSSIVFTAHDSGLACMALTHDGSFLATASDRGTLIRVFNSIYGSPIQELRRGADRAEIYSVAFSPTADWLAVSSDKGTIHVFRLNVTSLKSRESNSTSPAASMAARNPGSTFSFIKGVLPKYFSSEWSFAQFKLPEEMKSVVAFGQQEQILVLGTNGSFFKCFFDPAHGGDMKQLECVNFMKPIESICS